VRRLLTALLTIGLVAGVARGEAEPLQVLAAVTFRPALEAITAAYGEAGGGPVRVSYGPTPILARQVENGIPADIFLSADPDWMAHLATRGLIQEGSRIDVASTDLVLIAPRTNSAALTIGPGFPIASALGDGPLAVCHPDFHPAGRYARASLEALGVWAAVAPKVARVEHVQAAVAMVGRGEAPLGIVFATDVATDERVRVVGVFPRESHPPIVFPAAALAGSRHPDTGRFLRYLKSPDAVRIFTRLGYAPVP
jgi:molybdate transport system substrate-binding protein